MIRIGLLPELDRHGGGIFQYSATIMEALPSIAKDVPGMELVVFLPEAASISRNKLEADGWRIAAAEAPPNRARTGARRLVGEGPHREAWRWWRRRVEQRKRPAPPPEDLDSTSQRDDLKTWWRQQGVQLMIYPAAHRLAFEVGLPYVVAIHDLQHRLQPEFPEVSAAGEWDRREYVLRNCARHAKAILVDSDLGKAHVLFFYGPYGVAEDSVHVLPFLPASTLPREISAARQDEIRRKYRLPEKYILYPAQFWPHKNHARIIEALERLKRVNGLLIAVVFCGSRAEKVREQQFELLMNMARHCGVADQITVLDYVSDEHLAALYAGAVALVMPTFFGPTNIPVLEAWALDCPVLTSDIPGIREQAGDAAILIDPRMVDALADGILRLWNDVKLRRTLAERGRQRLAKYTPADYHKRLRDVLLAAMSHIA